MPQASYTTTPNSRNLNNKLPPRPPRLQALIRLVRLGKTIRLLDNDLHLAGLDPVREFRPLCWVSGASDEAEFPLSAT